MKTMKFTVALLTAGLLVFNANAQVLVERKGDPALEGPEKGAHQQLVPFLKGKLWGFSDVKKNIVIEPKFETVEFFADHNNMYYANGTINGKEVIITEDGKYLDDDFSDEYGSGGVLLGEMESEDGIYLQDMDEDKSLDKDGLHGYKYDDAKSFLRMSPVYARFLDLPDEGKLAVAVLKSTGKAGVITPEGKIVIPFIYDGLSGTAGENNEFLIFKKNGKQGMVDLTGKVIIPFEYSSISSVDYQSTRLLLTKEKNSAGVAISYLVNTANKKLYDGELLDAEYSEGLIRATTTRNKLFGFVNENGKVIIPFKYSAASLFGTEPAISGYAKVTNAKGVSFFINAQGVEYYSEK